MRYIKRTSDKSFLRFCSEIPLYLNVSLFQFQFGSIPWIVHIVSLCLLLDFYDDSLYSSQSSKLPGMMAREKNFYLNNGYYERQNKRNITDQSLVDRANSVEI